METLDALTVEPNATRANGSKNKAVANGTANGNGHKPKLAATHNYASSIADPYFPKESEVSHLRRVADNERTPGKLHLKKDAVYSLLTEAEVAFFRTHIPFDDPSVAVLRTADVFNLAVLPDESFSSIINLERVNDIRHIQRFFETINEKLPMGGFFGGLVETAFDRKQRILKKFPPILGPIYYFFDFVFKRLFPKLRWSKAMYFALTAGRNRVLPHTEVLGRLCACGFKIIDERIVDDKLHFIVQKNRDPLFPEKPSYGPVFRMNRIGKNGKVIGVYKMRTMHPFSEFLQEYIAEKQGLDDGGKFKDDPRVTSWGRTMRKLWLDELPMILNLFNGDMKIVGVRPLSRHYLSLYTEELREKRKLVKPGLIPPFYADLPKTLDEIMDSEMRYLDAYLEKGWRTDLTYLRKTFYNIVIKRARSK